MKVINVLLGLGLVNQSDAQTSGNNAELLFDHLNENYPKMLELYFEDGGATNIKVNNFLVKITVNFTVLRPPHV